MAHKITTAAGMTFPSYSALVRWNLSKGIIYMEFAYSSVQTAREAHCTQCHLRKPSPKYTRPEVTRKKSGLASQIPIAIAQPCPRCGADTQGRGVIRVVPG